MRGTERRAELTEGPGGEKSPEKQQVWVGHGLRNRLESSCVIDTVWLPGTEEEEAGSWVLRWS